MQNLDPQRSSDLTELIDQFLDESISDQGMLALSDALQESSSLRKYFLRYSQLHLDLGTEAEIEKHSVASFDEFSKRCDKIALLLREQSTPPLQARLTGQRAGVERARESRRGSRFAYAMALGVLFLLGVFSTVITYELGGLLRAHPGGGVANSQGSHDAQGSAQVPTVAHLTYINGCSWGGGMPTSRTLDSSVHIGEELVLHEGIAEFRLSSGVSLSVEGPCSLVITSPSSMVLQHGRVTAYVPWSVADFQLVAASCRITASDAELGTYVSGGEVELHAFSGHVVMDAANSGDPNFIGEDIVAIEKEELLPRKSALARVVVNPGRALAVESKEDKATVSKWGRADATQFATKLSMAGNLQINSEYVQSVLASRPVDYWRFEGEEDGMVRNELAGRPAMEIVGDLRFVGHSENHVIELGRPGGNGYLRCTEMLEIPAGDYSVEIWAKPSHVHVGGIVGMFTELPVGNYEKLAFYLQVCGTQAMWGAEGQRKFRYLHRSPAGHLHEMGTSCYSREHYTTRRWHHLAAVKQGPVMKLYVDGQLSSEERDETSLPPKLGLLVGQLTSPRHVGRFIGQLDEMAIYHRALDTKEIQDRMNSVDPKSGLPRLSSRMTYTSL